MSNMDETLKAYLAGIMDADGYFSIKASTYHARVRGDAKAPVYQERCGIKQTNPIAIDLLHEHFGGYRSWQKPTSKNGKPLHSWQATDKIAAKVAETLIPYLKIKRRQAEILIELRKDKDRPRKEQRIISGKPISRNRWGEVAITRWSLSPETLQRREALREEIKSLNDTRPHLQPKPIK